MRMLPYMYEETTYADRKKAEGEKKAKNSFAKARAKRKAKKKR